MKKSMIVAGLVLFVAGLLFGNVAALVMGLVLVLGATIAASPFRGCTPLVNIAEGTHEGSLTKKADAAITTRYLLVKFGTDVNHVAINTDGDKPLGVCTDEAAAAEDLVAVEPMELALRSQLMVASEIIALDADVFTADDGKVQNEPAVAGTYYKVGRAITAAGADGDVIEVLPCAPVALVVPA